ncbi:MAG TPA: pyrroline-5-carboxylate reductase [Candidatus Omnitrophota bacterium]|nr:pyrroline-5-carboxylate reductase [Candidatus Omnitrophota bacterium]HPD84027.1 pyrroline-5-carboxylate reductase [Candidatus Omnitrophota bacterium]HRZ02884.1 pyrroline-5-carboxylate reductase [Candidatus Omnitrophota bacterium]
MYKIGIIGGGNMGEAIISGCLKRFFVYVSEKDATRRNYLLKKYRLEGVDVKTLAQASEIIIIAVKPQDIDEVLTVLRSVVKLKDKLIISVAAGVTTRYLERKLGNNCKVVRTMPNMPALIGKGITAVCKGRHAGKKDVDLACKIFDNVGKTVVVAEELMNSVTAVSGSGPAYVYLFMECLIKAAQSLGLKEALAEELVKNTFSGSLELLLKNNDNLSPGILRARVTSKGGTTQAALEVFARRKFERIIADALKAAQKRAKTLSRG